MEDQPDKKRLFTAIRLAVRAHDGQLDKSGVPYIAHPLAVMALCRHHDLDTQIVAVLHDVVEDTDVSLQDIHTVFGAVVRDGVDAISQRSTETYRQYMERVLTNEHAVRAKYADLLHNSSPERDFSGSGGLMKRYRGSIEMLEDKFPYLRRETRGLR